MDASPSARMTTLSAPLSLFRACLLRLEEDVGPADGSRTCILGDSECMCHVQTSNRHAATHLRALLRRHAGTCMHMMVVARDAVESGRFYIACATKAVNTSYLTSLVLLVAGVSESHAGRRQPAQATIWHQPVGLRARPVSVTLRPLQAATAGRNILADRICATYRSEAHWVHSQRLHDEYEVLSLRSSHFGVHRMSRHAGVLALMQYAAAGAEPARTIHTQDMMARRVHARWWARRQMYHT